MNRATDRPSIGAVWAAFAATGSKAPKAAAAAHERLDATVTAFQRRPLPDAEALSLAVMAALDAGADPAQSPEVQVILAADALSARHQLADDIRGVRTDQLRTIVADQADAIVTAWRPGFDQAASDLGQAHEHLGPVDLGDTDRLIRQGPEATAAWSAAQRAIDIIDTVVAGWAGLLAFTTGQLVDRRYRLATIATVDPGRWLDLNLDHQPADPWAGLGHQLDLRLPTIDEHRAMVAAVDTERTERAEADALARQDAFTGRRRAATPA